MPRTIAWPIDHTEQALKLWNEGYSGGQIAKLLGYTRSAVMGKLYRMRNRKIYTDKPQQRETTNALAAYKPPKAKKKQVSKPAAVNPLPPKPLPPSMDPEHFGKLTIMELTSQTCRWPYGNENFTFCGELPQQGSPYCPKHSDIAFPRKP